MRISSLAGLTFLALAGGAARAADAGDWPLASGSRNFERITDGNAVALRRTACCGGTGTLQKSMPLDINWKNKTLRLSLRLKDDGTATTNVWLRLNRADGGVIRVDPQQNAYGLRSWQHHEFLVEVPPEALSVEYGVSAAGRGTSWIRDVTLEEVSPASPRSAGYAGRDREWSYVDYLNASRNDYNPPSFPLQQTTSPNQPVSSYEQGQRR